MRGNRVPGLTRSLFGLLGCLLLTIVSSCNDDPSRPPLEELSIENLSIDDSFDFANSRMVNLRFSVADFNNQPVTGVKTEVFTEIHDDPARNIPFLTGATGDDGIFTADLRIGFHIEQLYAGVNLPGFPNLIEVQIIGDNATHAFGGSGEGILNRAGNQSPLDADLIHFPDPTVTDGNMSIIIHSVSGVMVMESSELACVTPDGLVAGLTALSEEPPWGMAVWKDDQLTEERDGFLFQEPLRFLYWDPLWDAEMEVEVSVLNGIELLFQVNGLLVADMVVVIPDGYRYLGGWDDDGVPYYLSDGDIAFNGDFLRRLALNLPEGFDLETTHPDFIADELENSITILDSAEVWVSLVHDGSPHQNALGFYSYPSGQSPNLIEGIPVMTIVFPNASFYGEGGGLTAGNRVSLGRFGPNTSIGWFLVLNGWEDRAVGAGDGIIYSDPVLNGFGQEAPVHQAVMLLDEQSAMALLGFEDRLTGDPAKDNDFNDVMFAVTLSRFGSLFTGDMPVLGDDAPDRDGDGVPDMEDDYPDDPGAAFYRITPVDRGSGQFAFEDNWPRTDDYDYNDLVIAYRFNLVIDGDGLVRRIDGQFNVVAVGSASHNGFGFQMPIDPGSVGSVTGINLSGGLINLDGNGLEAGQSRAVVIVLDDVLAVASPAGGFNFVNTEPNSPQVDIDPISVSITMNEPINPAQLGAPPWNPFIFTGGSRENEIHLADQPPTDLVNMERFGTENDRSVPGENKYYRSVYNLPWALDLTGGWRHPVEGAQLLLAYPFFVNWAESGGIDAQNWYLPLPGNFNEDYIW